MRRYFRIQIVLFIVSFMLLPLNSRAQKAIIQKQDAKNYSESSDFTKDIFLNLGLIPSREDGVSLRYPSQIFEHSSNMEKFPGHKGGDSDLMPFAVKISQLSPDVLDSVIFNRCGQLIKDSFIYGDNPKRFTLVRQWWYEPANDWANRRRMTLTYDGKGNRLTELEEQWGTNTGKWENDSRNTSTYDGDDNMLMNLYQKWDANAGEWLNVSRIAYTYDSSDNRLTELDEGWDANTRSWVNSRLFTRAYDAFGNCLTTLDEEWYSGKWVNNYGYACVYDSSGNRIAKLEASWDKIVGIWVNDNLTIYSYDRSSNMLTKLYGLWDTNAQQWTNSWQRTYTYDESGAQLTHLYEKWDKNAGSWVNIFRNTHTYNENGNLLIDLYEEWDTNVGVWINLMRSIFTYDNSGNMIHFQGEAWSGSVWNNDDCGMYLLKIYDFAYLYIGREFYAYYSPATSVDNSADNKTVDSFSLSQNFPNPFNPSTSISYSVPERTHVKIAVFNSVGQSVSILVDGVRLPGNYEVTFDGSNLTSGIYFYKIITDKLVETKRMILVK